MIKEELILLKQEGYTSLFKKRSGYAYYPSKKSVEDIAEFISNTPLNEDELISMDDAIEYFDDQDLKYGRIVFINIS